ncbi:hypothetical protein [Natrinema sp. 1APR25-10V2]|uniref:hypothetical protein n=1 Tax=Natrinema sp. 1APR25-10V2 TaxID=2951081 RepID=UPI002874C77F|nr:hypothetical protein [Natrinema sp. 1APR25-10V2]MDS0477645.1 hypothetical protein [Natrinema sp. 1APR25-10V2]
MWNFEDDGDEPLVWTAVDAPAEGTVYDVIGTANGPCAVGDGGTVVGRAADGSWGIIVPDGPGARGETLRAVAATDDGRRIWFCGTGGAVGYFDLESGRRVDCSRPDGMDVTFHALAVSDDRASEKLLLADGNGVALPGTVDGENPAWDRRTTPADGTAITALSADESGYGYGVDGNGAVWKTTPSGRDRIGIADAEDSLYAAAASASTLVVGGGNGRFYERDETGGWTPHSLGDAGIECLDVDGSTRLVGREGGLLRVRERGTRRETDWDGTATVHGVLAGSPHVAVCENGLVLESTAE